MMVKSTFLGGDKTCKQASNEKGATLKDHICPLVVDDSKQLEGDDYQL